MSAQPIISFLDGATLSAPIGGERAITLRFDNIPDAGPGSSVGYSPYVNLILPTNGADGAGAGNALVNDGVAFLGATYLGVALEQWVLEFPASGQVTHPFTTDALGNPVIVTSTPGETLVVLRLPFGSFTDGQTAADIQVRLEVSDLADLGKPLTLQASGGFAYGRDPLLNPVADAPVFGPATKLTVTPTVIELDKVYVGPEQETATGPSYAREWLVKALIAEGQTVTGLKLTDVMPDGTLIKSVSIENGTGTTSFDNKTGLVEAKFDGSYTGGGPAPTLKIEFYVPEFLRDGVTPVLDPVTGAFRVLENNARLDATWDPNDGRDPIEVFAIDPSGPEDIITAKSIAVQKSVVPVTTLKAGENLEWTLDGQVSNYFNMGDLELIDTLGDGQVFDSKAPVTITMNEGGKELFSGTIDPANITVTRDPATGISTIRFDISQEMRDRKIDDVLNGRPGGDEHQATVLVRFQSTIEERYIATKPAPPNESLVDQGDPLVNDVDFGGVVDESGKPKSDDSDAGVTLPVSEVGKSIYAINGSTVLPPGMVKVAAGDSITFRLTLDMPLTGAHDVALSDFLPLPVLKAIAGMTFTDAVNGVVPGANQAKWGPGATFDSSGDPTTNPSISFDAVSNALKFDFGDAVAPGNPSSRIDLLFTVVVQDEEFGDGLLLTNQVTSTETNSFGAVSEDNAIVQFVLGEPELNITKGVIADSNPNANPTTNVGPAGITFTAPGSAGNRFTGTINSNALDSRLIDADLTGADAGDRVSFAIVVENTGSSLRGAFDVLIRDTLPPGFEIPAGGLNLRVTDGAGNVLPFTIEGSSIFDPVGGIRLGDATNSGAIGTYSATSGDNIVVITYDLELIDTVAAFGADLVNTATIEHFAAKEGGIDRTDFTPTGDLSDTAFVRTQTPTPAKVVTATSEAHTGTQAGSDSLTDLTIGERVTYTITVTVPEGAMTDFRVEDWLPTSNAAGGGVMTMLAARFIGVNGLGGGSIFDTTPEITLIDSDLVNGFDRARFDFGNVLNTANTTGTQPATITLEVDARVNNNAANVAGDKLTNTVVVSAVDPDAPGGRTETRASVDVEVVEPNLDVIKTAARIAPTAGSAPVTADAGDTVRYTITVENKGVPGIGNDSNFTARAWDVSIKDLLADVLLDATVTGNVTITGVSSGRITDVTPGSLKDVDFLIDYLDPGEKITITLDVVIDADADAGERLDNTAKADGSTLDGPGATPTDPWDRVKSDTDDERVTIAAPSVSKIIVATSDANTRGPSAEGTVPANRHGGNVDLRIGEEVTYEIRVRLPEGDSPNLRISDLLEDLDSVGNGSLTYIPGSVEIVSIGSNLKTFTGGSLPTPAPVVDNAGGLANNDRVVLSFGDVRNSTSNSEIAYDPANNQEFIVLRLKAVVNDVAQNNDADVLDNTGRYDTGTTGTPATNGTNTVRVDVVEPDLSIDKASSIVGGAALDAGALVNYSITIQHSGSSDAPAYDLALTDLIPAGMELVAGTLVASAGSVGNIGNAIAWRADQYLLGAPAVTITYQARLLDTVTPVQVLSNTARLVYDSNPADPVDPLNPTAAEDLASRSYNAQDTETRTVALAPTIDKSVIATGDTNTGSGFVNAGNPDAAPGEIVTYRLTVTVGEGTQRLVVSDSLPTGLIFESASVESIGATITGSALAVGAAATSVSGGAYSFDFGTIVNAGDNDRDAGDTVTILVTGRVATSATAGATLTNTAKAETFAPGGGKPGLATVTDDAKIDVVRPDLVIVKDAVPGMAGDAGNLVTYTVTLSHAAGSTAPAYLLNLSDILPAGVTLVAGSAMASVGTITESGGSISYALNQYLLGAPPVTITYQARLAGNIIDGQSITNTAQVTYSSAPVLGVSTTESDPATVTTDIVNTVVKTLESTSYLGTLGSAVGIGEEVTFLVTATLGEGAQRIVLRDVLPTGLDFLDSELVSLGGITGSALSVGADGVYDAGTRTLSFNLGDITNPFNNVNSAADQVVFRVVAMVADIGGNTAGKVLTNVGAVDSAAPVNPYGVTPGSSSTTVTENEAVTVVRASLGGIAFRDVDGDGVREAGDTVLAGIPVTLLNADGTPTGFTAVTGPDGSYLFDDLIPGSYRVRFDEVGGNERTLANVGIDTTDSDADQASGITAVYTLASGDAVRNVDAGFYQLARLGDRVWEDTNGDGVQNDGATGIAGVTVRLLDALGNEVTRTVTGADGFYAFTGLVPGDYSVSVLRGDYIATTRNAGGNANEATDSDVNVNGRSDTFFLESGEDEPRVDAGFYRGAKLGGTLFEDVNGDGLQGGPGEGGVSGRLVELLDSAGNPTGRTTFTDSNGNYLFDTLAPGTYAVRFVPDTATPFTKANVGLNNDQDSDANVTTGRTEQVTLASGGDDRTLDAGIYRPAAIGDRVWEDVNGNGRQDLGEGNVAGATVRLLNVDGTPVVGVSPITTTSDGSYAFTGLAPGDYRVEVTRAGFTPTQRDAAADGVDSDIGSDGRTDVVNLSSGETDNSVDAGLYRPAALGNRVWLDADNDGRQDLGEAGVSGVTVNLLRADGTPTGLSTVTGPDGIYGFSNLAPGDYRVEFVAPANRAFGKQDQVADDNDSDVNAQGRTGIVTLDSGENDTSVDAALVELGDLTGRAWVDRDGDGREEAGEASRAGIVVRLLNADGSFTGRTETTDPDGVYLFQDVIAGDYRVEFIIPPGLNLTLPNVPGDDTIDSDPTSGGITGLVSVFPAETTRDVDAGVYVPASLGDRVWHDLDADGIQDDNEPGLADVTVQLLAADGVTVIATDTTDGSGQYGFDGLAPGQYGVRVLRPTGFELSQRDRTTDDARDSDANSAGVIAPTMLFSGDARTDLDAGLFQRVQIGDRAWLDTDRDGVQGPTEQGARGVTVRLLDADGDEIATTVTDLNGNYSFRDLLPGSYSVQFLAPIGMVFTQHNRGNDDAADSDANMVTGRTQQVTLTSGQVNNTLDAGLLIGGSIGDRVWADLDRDGQQDDEEPGIAGATVRLLNRDGTTVVSTTTTDASGFYSFGDLRPAGYIVEFVTPAAHTPTVANVGADVSDSDAAVGGRTGVISVAGGTHVRTVDAGFVPNVVGTCDLPTTLLTPANDGYSGTPGGDHVDGLAGNDNIHGLGGNDCLIGNDGDDAINGHDGDDKIQGGRGNDNLHGNDGRDHIFGGDGDDIIEGGNDNDWLEGGAGNDNMQGEGGDDVVLGGAGDDIVVGNQGNDTVFGGSGNDTVSGHEGNDVIGGGTDNGRASLVGGKVSGLVLGDTVFGDGDADRFIYQRGDGVDWLPDFNPLTGDTLTIYGHASFTAVENINGQTVLYLGVNSAIVLNLAYPASSLAGPFPGITFVPGTLAAPEIPAERGAIMGGVGADSLVGGAGNDLIEGLQGNDTLVGNAGADTLRGDAGNDWLIGGLGADVLDGGAGTDAASYANATAAVTVSLAGGPNAGTFALGDSLVNVENLIGSNFADRLTGDGSANRIVGGGGNDTILGGAGGDELLGGAGQDSLAGGLGADRFIWGALAESAAATPDAIADFAWAQGDRIDLSGIDANLALAGDQAFVFVGGAAFAGGGQGSVRTLHSGGDTMVEIDQGNGGAAEAVIRLVGLHSLAASDFVL